MSMDAFPPKKKTESMSEPRAALERAIRELEGKLHSKVLGRNPVWKTGARAQLGRLQQERDGLGAGA